MRNRLDKVIVDGDWGGDEMQVMAVFLGCRTNIAGITAVYGNAPHDQVLQNGLNILTLLNAEHILCYPGAKGPLNEPAPEGDGAHGNDGMGGTTIAASKLKAQDMLAADFILKTLRNEPAGTVTITATGPLTNIATAFLQGPETMKRVKNILVMGGCTSAMPAHDMPTRQGNITPFAEFNFFMASEDAKTVLDSGLPITLFPMNCTQQLSFTPERRQNLMDVLRHSPEKAATIAEMMSAPADFDRFKFNADPFMHDIHVALGALHPNEYSGRKGFVSVVTEGDEKGRTDFIPDEKGTVFVMETVRNADKLFSIYLNNLADVIEP